MKNSLQDAQLAFQNTTPIRQCQSLRVAMIPEQHIAEKTLFLMTCHIAVNVVVFVKCEDNLAPLTNNYFRYLNKWGGKSGVDCTFARRTKRHQHWSDNSRDSNPERRNFLSLCMRSISLNRLPLVIVVYINLTSGLTLPSIHAPHGRWSQR